MRITCKGETIPKCMSFWVMLIEVNIRSCLVIFFRKKVDDKSHRKSYVVIFIQGEVFMAVFFQMLCNQVRAIDSLKAIVIQLMSNIRGLHGADFQSDFQPNP